MARRKQSTAELLVLAPWWLSVVFAVLAFVLMRWAFPAIAGGNTFLNSLALVVTGLAPYAAAFFGLLAVLSAVFSKWRATMLDSQKDRESISNLSWKEFEWLVGEAYRRQGFSIEESLGGGADGGVDVVLRRDGEMILVQCKHWKTLSVGAPVVREMFGLVGHHEASGAIVITSGGFTREAEAFAEGKPITLVDGPRLLELIKGVQRIRNEEPEPAPQSVKTSAPVCAKCGTPMVLRSAKRGANAGNSFWGCSSYPKCTGTRPV
jgi:restriction system protein